MMHRWLPWRYMIKNIARSQGFLDPLSLYARLQQFAQPSEVSEPVELLRAGAVFHARGLLNSRVLQHNLDWVWPYWIERQFDPADISFMPRAFSLTHVNLTHRNWTAIGLPGRQAMPIVDPRGLLTPFWDSWSIDVWCFDRDGEVLLPSRCKEAEQWQEMDESLSVITRVQSQNMQLETRNRMEATEHGDVIRLTANANLTNGGWIVVALRPCNPEGVSFIDHVVLDRQSNTWTINDSDSVVFDRLVDEHHTSRYHDADVYVHLRDRIESDSCRCRVGLLSAAASFAVEPGNSAKVSIDIPVKPANNKSLPIHLESGLALQNWSEALEGKASLDVPDGHYRSLYEAAVRTLVLCTPDDCYAGPFTYKRYWYRDAAFIGHGLLCAGLVGRVEHLVSRFPERQSKSGYFHSQEGEWDANGEVLWLADRLSQVTGQSPDATLWSSLKSGADWIDRKRLPDYGGQPHEGLLPAGFSAEHLGPNDHYYWDNYWSLAGLNSAARLALLQNNETLCVHYQQRAEALQAAIERSLQRLPDIPGMPAIPAAPTRRLDAGAIGSVVVSYPLQLCDANDSRLLGTLEFLLKYCFHQNGFFQDMIHSGINAYLTLHVAQALLRAGDPRFADLIREVARLASPTGHWPEAVHPHTSGGCMGDGHHAWAAAEWIAMIRSCFIREEQDTLILASGILPEWLVAGKSISFGPTPTRFGTITVSVTPHHEHADGCRIGWKAHWHDETSAISYASKPRIRISLPGLETNVIEEAEPEGSIDCRRINA